MREISLFALKGSREFGERVAEHLGRYIDAGANYLILAPFMPPQKRLEHLERLAMEVLPQLGRITPPQII